MWNIVFLKEHINRMYNLFLINTGNRINNNLLDRLSFSFDENKLYSLNILDKINPNVVYLSRVRNQFFFDILTKLQWILIKKNMVCVKMLLNHQIVENT